MGGVGGSESKREREREIEKARERERERRRESERAREREKAKERGGDGGGTFSLETDTTDKASEDTAEKASAFEYWPTVKTWPGFSTLTCPHGAPRVKSRRYFKCCQCVKSRVKRRRYRGTSPIGKRSPP